MGSQICSLFDTDQDAGVNLETFNWPVYIKIQLSSLLCCQTMQSNIEVLPFIFQKLTGRYLNLLGRGEQASCVFTKGITDGGRELIFHKPLRPGYGST